MNKYRIYILILTFAFVNCIYATQPLVDLVKRILPEEYDKEFIFNLSEENSKEDFFELRSENGMIVISGNNNVSIASGLNWYLKYYCNCSFSFCENQLKLPKKLPKIESPVRMKAILNNNFYMNYCTFSYTTAFWDWERWEKEIDLMALNGINTPMAMVGVEVVWRNTLRQFGYTDKEIKEFLCGPAYLGWFLMANLEKHGGPLPDEWFDRQIELQKKILKRMREFGMTPVFQAFYGMVPNSLSLKYPEAKVVEQGEWMGFKRPLVLLATDPLFEDIAGVWYEEYEALFGKADCFAGDLFHEGGKTDGINVTEVATGVQTSMLNYNPNARWFIQAWGNNPRSDLLAGLDKKHTVIIDISAEFWKRWKERKGFDGFPWIWGHVTNYGANVGLHGRLDAIAHGVFDAFNDPYASKCIYGIGAAPEGIEVNPVAFELANEIRWRKDTLNMEEWIKNYADRRYGSKNKNIEDAWSIFYHTVYGSYEKHRRPSESVFCACPSLKGKRITASAWSQCKIFYNPDEFAKGVDMFLKESEKYIGIKTYEYDAVDLVRQYLADLGRNSYMKFVNAYKRSDKKEFKKESDRFLEILMDQDKLLSMHYSFNICKWINQARAASSIKEIQDFYEYNARQLVTTWSDKNTSLRDYGHKEWGGMLRDFYYPRWKTYITYLQDKLDGKKVEEPDFYSMERMWVESNSTYEFQETLEIVKKVKSLFEKYYK